MPGFAPNDAGIICLLIFAPLLQFFQVQLSQAQSPKLSRPEVPSAIQASPDEEIILIAHATGSQVYTCQRGEDGRYAWTLKAPEAELKDDEGRVIGTHSAGPAWTLQDGSEVQGKASARADSPDPEAIPWLLVKVVSNAGKGLLANATTIQRIHTRGGKAPVQGCDAEHNGTETKTSYTADYYFYGPAARGK